MPLLGVLLSGLLGSLATFFAKFVTRKLAVIGAAMAALATITTTALLAMNTIVTPLVANLFNTQYGTVIGLAFPPAAGNCMAAIGLSWAACALFKWQFRALAISIQA